MGVDASNYLKQVAGILGASGVALGALGAHALHPRLVEAGKVDNFRVAVLYQLLHASALVGISAMCKTDSENSTLERVGQMFTVGTTMFSGSIYLLVFNIGPKKLLGPTTPLGGLILISGWTMLAFS